MNQHKNRTKLQENNYKKIDYLNNYKNIVIKWKKPKKIDQEEKNN